MSSRYHPVTDYLAGLPPETVTVTLTLLEVEGVLGQALPLTAHFSSWWRNDPARRQALGWLRVGWHVTRAQVRQAPSAITFTRVS